MFYSIYIRVTKEKDFPEYLRHMVQFACFFAVNILAVQITRSTKKTFLCAVQRLNLCKHLFLTNCFAVQNIYLLLQSTSEEADK
jgi:hypothetical protein